MLRRTVGATGAAALLSVGLVAAGQTTPQAPTQSPVQSGTPGASQPQPARPDPTATSGQVTMTGCVTREVAGQFALSNAVRSSGATESSGDADVTRGSAASADRDGTVAATGTSGSTRAGSGAATDNMTYSLAGDREIELEKYVGQRVEIVGMLSAPAPGSRATSGAESPGAGGSASGGDAARAPVTRPEGTRADANRGSTASGHAPRLTIVSFRPAGGDCANR